MRRKNMKKTAALFLLSVGVNCMTAQDIVPVHEFDIDVQKVGSPIQSTMYGIFFEDINFGADGGLYAELIKNRSFEFENPWGGWEPFGDASIAEKNPCFDKNPHYAHLTYAGQITGTGLENEGFKGIGIKANENYDFSLYARTETNNPIKLRIELVNRDNDIYETQHLEIKGKDWKKYSVILSPKATEAKSRLRITMETAGTLDLEHISLFPEKTFNNRTNGLRRDLAQALKDLKPGIFRFPGGCIVEGTTIPTRYQWKNTVGPIENRPININRWNYTFPHKKFPDYYQSYGLGFFEYFQLSEDIGAEPLPVLNCGLSCQFENEGMDQHVPVDKLQPYIDDALDLIEFANGPVTSQWGKVRADMGHPASFNLKFIAIGNEQWGPLYPERLEPFVKAIRAKYPEIKIIGSSGPNSEGKDFEYLWPEMKRLKVDLVDEHFYRPENWFLNEGARYDNYDRKGPKVFAGEYACHGKGKKWNHFNAALLEAAFMTGLERNADIVHMATYAPLFAHVEGWQWRPDMIWFDNLNSVRTVSYYVQQLYGHHKGTNVLSLMMNKKPVTGAEGQNGLFASAVYDKNKNEIIVKVANTSDRAQPLSLKFEGLKKQDVLSGGCCIKLRSADPDKDNTIEQPSAIQPQETSVSIDSQVLSVELEPKTFAVYIFKKG